MPATQPLLFMKANSEANQTENRLSERRFCEGRVVTQPNKPDRAKRLQRRDFREAVSESGVSDMAAAVRPRRSPTQHAMGLLGA